MDLNDPARFTVVDPGTLSPLKCHRLDLLTALGEYVMTVSFNGPKRPDVVTWSGRTYVLRGREEYRDMVRLEGYYEGTAAEFGP